MAINLLSRAGENAIYILPDPTLDHKSPLAIHCLCAD